MLFSTFLDYVKLLYECNSEKPGSCEFTVINIGGS